MSDDATGAFSVEQTAGDPVLSCAPRAGTKKTKFDGWGKKCVLKIFCPQDKKMIDRLAKTQLTVADSITFEDKEFDGANWISSPFPAGGVSNSEEKRIGVLSGDSCEEVALTFYHELIHQAQDKHMSWEEMEVDAYYRTEKWAIKQGLPSQSSGFRKKDKNGKRVPDKDAIRDFVTKEYPAEIVGIIKTGKNKGHVKLGDGSIRPPKKGDKIPGPMKTKGLIKVDTSGWSCPD